MADDSGVWRHQSAGSVPPPKQSGRPLPPLYGGRAQSGAEPTLASPAGGCRQAASRVDVVWQLQARHRAVHRPVTGQAASSVVDQRLDVFYSIFNVECRLSGSGLTKLQLYWDKQDLFEKHNKQIYCSSRIH